MEKSKFLLFLSLPLLLTPCSNPGTISKNSLASSSDENEIKTANIPLNFVFEHVYDSEDNPHLASLLYQSNYFSDNFDELEIPQDLIAGDLLNIEYTGEIIATESYPGTFYLNGEIILYNFEKTKIIENDIKEDLLTIDNLSQSYILENEFVILNNKDATIVNEKHYSLYDAKFFKDLFSLDDKIDEDKLIANYIKPSLTNFSLKGEIHLSSIYH